MLWAQKIFAERVRSMRVYGNTLAGFPVALLTSQPVTISFDVDAPEPEHFRIKVIHCDRNWKPTLSMFLNDEVFSMPVDPLPYEEAPPTITHYRWTYTVQLPGFAQFKQFRYSGNYRIEIWNRTATELIATAKIIVAEEKNDSLLLIEKYQLPSASYPWYQAHRIFLQYVFPSFSTTVIDPNFLRTADVYINRNVEQPRRIDVDDKDPWTFVRGRGTPRLTFQIDNILPGNEYRTFDFRDVTLYPPSSLVRNINGADVNRMFHFGEPDHDGASFLVEGNRFAEYEKVQFEVLVPHSDGDSIYVVGDFNQWIPSEHWRLLYDSVSSRYVLTAYLRRGCYDYQYVCNGDWYALEGNDWRTENVYTAVVYYHDPNLGGYDRIVLCAQQKSSGIEMQSKQ